MPQWINEGVAFQSMRVWLVSGMTTQSINEGVACLRHDTPVNQRGCGLSQAPCPSQSMRVWLVSGATPQSINEVWLVSGATPQSINEVWLVSGAMSQFDLALYDTLWLVHKCFIYPEKWWVKFYIDNLHDEAESSNLSQHQWVWLIGWVWPSIGSSSLSDNCIIKTKQNLQTYLSSNGWGLLGGCGLPLVHCLWVTAA